MQKLKTQKCQCLAGVCPDGAVSHFAFIPTFRKQFITFESRPHGVSSREHECPVFREIFRCWTDDRPSLKLYATSVAK